ncbi:alpha-(1,3)-fucosyltransferase C-like [Drosophila innubila]|uniref:alpha-(1,3)-fucosyltransferase C-like n=1 Tax=Drosophila innubila TaxID=198719 RepID=UPI00148C3A88|nr:alpha-(1,3)-fucosyltransferase C-like [Drosophila innubila]
MPTDKILSNRLNLQSSNLQTKEKVEDSAYNKDCDEVGYYELSILPPPHYRSVGSPNVIPYRCIGRNLNHIILRCVLSIFVVYLLLHLVQHSEVIKSVEKSNGYAILIWNEDEVLPGWDHLQCGCVVTSNRDYDKRSIDAVVVYSHIPYSLTGLEKIRHTPDYLVVFAATHPLSLAQNPLYAHGDSVFNFTMSYRLDSDLIWTNYYFSTHSQKDERVQKFDPQEELILDELPIQLQLKLRQLLAKKQFSVVYMMYDVNDYTLPESLYLEELRQYIDLDAYVSCYGYQDCSHYKFMLIFDPSSCPDYVHPQFYMALDNFVVPVLIGGSNLTNLAPPGSYISSSEFNSPKCLAEHLNKLAKEPQLYEQLFWWHLKYQLQKIRQPYCTLCHQLRRIQRRQRRQRQPDMFRHWWTQYQCSNRTNRLGWSPK